VSVIDIGVYLVKENDKKPSSYKHRGRSSQIKSHLLKGVVKSFQRDLNPLMYLKIVGFNPDVSIPIEPPGCSFVQSCLVWLLSA